MILKIFLQLARVLPLLLEANAVLVNPRSPVKLAADLNIIKLIE